VVVKVTDKVEVQALTDALKKQVRWSTVSLSDVLTGGLRLESSYFNIEGKQAREVIKNCRWKKMPLWGDKGLTTGYHRPRFKRTFLEKSDYPIYQPSQINEICPKPNLYISKLTSTDIEKLRVKKGQILLTCSGTIGNVTLVSETLNNLIFSHDLIRLTAKEQSDTGYIYAFLKTRTGNVLINTNNYGAVVQHIEPEHLESILIPDPDTEIKRKINSLILESFELRDQSNYLVKEADKLLVSELSLPMIDEFSPKYLDKKSGIRSYEVKLSKLDGRLDASNHVPLVRSILNHLAKYAEEVTTLGDSRISKSIIAPGRFKRVYVEEGQGVVFFGGKQMLELDPYAKKYLSLSRHEGRINKELTLMENMILVTCSGTVGKVNIVPKHWQGWTANQHIIRVVPAEDSIGGFIYSWLSSDYGYDLIRRFKYGAVVDEIDGKQTSEVQIPLLKNKGSQEKINDLVLEANQKRYEAYLMEQEAINIVNTLVLGQSQPTF
jgi:type I restriction enzyme S subunit